MTLFPDAVDAMMNASIIGRAQERGFVTIRTHQIREFTTNRQMQVDDYPYGGGRGAVMQADPLYRCWQHICDEAGGLEAGDRQRKRRHLPHAIKRTQALRRITWPERLRLHAFQRKSENSSSNSATAAFWSLLQNES